MKNFKRISSLMLATTLCFSLAACGEKKEVTEVDTNLVVDEETTESLIKDIEASGNGLGEAVGEVAGTIVDKVEESTETVPAPEPGPAPTEPEEVVTDNKTVALSNVFESLKDAFGENFLANMELDAETFNSILGIDSTMYTDFIAYQAPMSSHVDRLYVVKATNVNEVKAKFDDFRLSLINDTMQYPSNLEKIAGSVVDVKGDYVFFYILGGYPENVEDTENQEVMKEFVTEANTKLETVLNKLFK